MAIRRDLHGPKNTLDRKSLSLKLLIKHKLQRLKSTLTEIGKNFLRHQAKLNILYFIDNLTLAIHPQPFNVTTALQDLRLRAIK